MSYVFRGLALVQRYEELLKRGEIKIDVPAHIQFRDKLPIVRRVKHGQHHLVATYDPWVDEGKQGRDITLTDFDGHPGMTVILPSLRRGAVVCAPPGRAQKVACARQSNSTCVKYVALHRNTSGFFEAMRFPSSNT